MIEDINNKEKGLSVRLKLNEAINAVNDLVDTNIGEITAIDPMLDNLSSVDKLLLVDVSDTTGDPLGTNKTTTLSDISSVTQGYYSLLSNFYFTGGVATTKEIASEDTGQWIDVELTIDTQGKFDNRPMDMKTAQPVGHLGSGAQGDPICFKLEGLTTKSSASLRTSLTFDPDVDGGRFDSRLLFKRHTGATPSQDFSIESNSLNITSGASLDYSFTPNIQFFIGDTIDTNGVGDAGTVQVQIRTDVAGTVSMRELALFIQY